jgi:hypothetical protein
MAMTEPTVTTTAAARPSCMAALVSYVVYGLIIVLAIMLIVGVGVALHDRLTLPAAPDLPALTLPTADTARLAPTPRPISDPISEPNPNRVQSDIDAYNATETAQYQHAIDAPAPNVNITNDSAPIETEAKPAARQPAGENVPTAEPIAQPAGDDQTGSKPVLVNPQEAHQCLHGAVWTENGCKNPTPQGGG